jgi:hypothetical protein
MKPVRDLDRLRRPLGSTFGVAVGTISGDDFDFRMFAEPRGECVGLTIIQQVDGLMLFKIAK